VHSGCSRSVLRALEADLGVGHAVEHVGPGISRGSTVRAITRDGSSADRIIAPAE